MTLTELEPTTIEQLDFEPGCEIPDCDTDQPATWVLRNLICGCTWLLCDLCASMAARDIAIDTPIDGDCIICGTWVRDTTYNTHRLEKL